MKDTQGERDERNIPIDQVGVSDLKYPIVVLDRARERQYTIANLSMSVGLPSEFKGTHMSRFIEVLNEHRGEVTLRTMPAILDALRQRLEAKSARLEVRFPYFLERVAPVSGASALMDYECWFIGESVHDSKDELRVGVRVPVTSLCPCSKSISDYGAHNKRGYINIEVRPRSLEDLIWIEDLVTLAEGAASAPVYPLLKRSDERHVTMQAYDNPAFVEDIVRNVAVLSRAPQGSVARGVVRRARDQPREHPQSQRLRSTLLGSWQTGIAAPPHNLISHRCDLLG